MTAPIFPYPGGKRRLAKKILPLFPKHTCYLEAFVGAGSILLAKEPSKSEVMNDLNGELINFFRMVRHHPKALNDELKWMLPSRMDFERSNAKNPESLTELQRAARFLFLQKLAFGGRVKGRNYGNINTTKASRFNPHELWDGIEDIHRRLSSVQIENLPWREAIERYDRDYTLIYADPPYLGFKNYSHSFTIKDYEELADVAKSIEGTIFISHKEHPEIRKLFRAMDVKEFPFDYSFQKGGRKKVVELVFCNREIPQ